jgi:hypothetical protein
MLYPIVNKLLTGRLLWEGLVPKQALTSSFDSVPSAMKHLIMECLCLL